MPRLGFAILLLSGCGAFLGCGAAHKTGVCDGPCPSSAVRHLVVLVQENHTFDNHFGRYCTATSAPDCTTGPSCCEAGPALEPGGASPVDLDDTAHEMHDPSHDRACETDDMDGGKMDHYVTGGACGNPGNFAYSDPQIIQPYWTLAATGALADRYFQPVIGQSSANDMYLTRARWAFDDNTYAPDAIGHECSFIQQTMEFDDPTIDDLLTDAGVSWAWYVEGYQVMKEARAQGKCPEPPDACGAGLSIEPCVLDPADIPAEYRTRFRDDPRYIRDFEQFGADIDSGKLPQVVFVKALGYHNEHPGLRTKLSDGVKFATDMIKRVQGSTYHGDTLLLLTYDEGGGYFDHVSPPPSVDDEPYGTRVPLLALGPFARANAVSHVVLEHSSLVKWIEWNWLGASTGQLGARDALVANLGSLLDPALGIPEN